LRRDERILDLGGGDGKVTANLARAGRHGAVVGIDSFPEMIGYAIGKFSGWQFVNLEFQLVDARRMLFPHCLISHRFRRSAVQAG